MDFGTILGLLSGVGIILLGILRQDGDVGWFWSLNSFIIVLGGTIAASMVNYPMKNILGLFSVVKNVFSSDENDYQGIIEEIVEKGEKARKNGVLSLEADFVGHEAFFINSLDTISNTKSEELIKTFYPESEIKKDLEDYETLISVEKAIKLLGWDPQATWRK